MSREDERSPGELLASVTDTFGKEENTNCSAVCLRVVFIARVCG